MDEREQQTADTQSLQEQAYLALRRAIIFAQYKPGERLVPKQICEELNLGRTPVRESLVRLQQQGLVRTVPQSGTYVSRIDSRAAECSRFAREHLEQQVAIECCARIDDAGIALLDETIAQQEQAVAGQRRSQVGTGMRNERIRTYNFPQRRVTDHRIGLTLHKLDNILNGELDELIDALLLARQREEQPKE